MGLPRLGVHTLPTLIVIYNLLAWFGSWKILLVKQRKLYSYHQLLHLLYIGIMEWEFLLDG